MNITIIVTYFIAEVKLKMAFDIHFNLTYNITVILKNI